MVSYAEKAHSLISQHQFLMLSKSWCPDCHYAIAIFKKYGVLDKVHILELDKLEESEASQLEKAFTQISGRKWVPTIFANGEKFGTEEDLKRLESYDSTEEEFRKIGLLK
ncbi:unnamed protein product [Kuraishia capsulata CBS 1993]|uniref:Glutaredoxin domain-containing protein n=1 Tax=Kuraishia capsulata CBS 1993 TaxID=1382522 RepID=W6MGQ4_9ASCO|nr:uncharacterized protein KUCA_T00000729001 [Kuraishia capsulata CBS 1993]CDK24763.1 unnamed protein product [Kuraishia capsulata CBS 1993]